MNVGPHTPLVLDNPTDRRAAARSCLYALLAEGFAYPQADGALRVLNGDLLGEISDSMDVLEIRPPAWTDEAEQPLPTTVPELQRIYTGAFDATGGRPDVSMLERNYGTEGEQKLWEQLLAFYSHFGLDFSAGYAEEQPDHLLTELGFMHYLAFLEAGSLRSAGDLKRGQRDFLDLHLARWVPEFAEALKAVAWYSTLANLLSVAVVADREAVNAAIGARTKSA